MSDRHYARVEVHHGTMETTVGFFCDPDDDNDVLIATAKRMTRKMRTLPMAYESFKIIERRPALPEEG